MNCEQANQIDLVDYLYLLGYQAQKIRSQDYWYLSPLREEYIQMMNRSRANDRVNEGLYDRAG